MQLLCVSAAVLEQSRAGIVSDSQRLKAQPHVARDTRLATRTRKRTRLRVRTRVMKGRATSHTIRANVRASLRVAQG